MYTKFEMASTVSCIHGQVSNRHRCLLLSEPAYSRNDVTLGLRLVNHETHCLREQTRSTIVSRQRWARRVRGPAGRRLWPGREGGRKGGREEEWTAGGKNWRLGWFVWVAERLWGAALVDA